MKTNLKKSLLSVAAMAIFSLCLAINANASAIHIVAVSDTGKMSKMSKMSKPSKMKAKKTEKMSKMSKDSSKMSKM
jgi:hypothetical protein